MLNPERHDRFKAEIEAIRRLRHPSIITLIDHSAPENLEGEVERQYLVMPIAAGGSLADPGRVALYKDSIDVTLQVALQLAGALEAAHTAGIIHRDVKPANVLFTGNGHEIWLSDFGICLIREMPRNTELHEVVGPRSFMAPELERGGPQDVTPAADIYSLGKVIYFMLSGGTTLPREDLHDPQFARLFEGGDRHRLVLLLLERMVCLFEGRLKGMSEVIEQIKAIEAWERSAMSLALDAPGRDKIARLQSLARRNDQAAQEASAARASREQLLARVSQAFSSWAESELAKIAAYVGTSQITVTILPVVQMRGEAPWIKLNDDSPYELIAGRELAVEIRDPTMGHALQLILCVRRTIKVHVHNGWAPPPPPDNSVPELIVLSCYARHPSAGGPGAPPRRIGYLTRGSSVGQMLGKVTMPTAQRTPPTIRSMKLTRVGATFLPDHSLYTRFKADEWALAAEKIHAQLQESVGGFIDFVMEQHGSIGP